MTHTSFMRAEIASQPECWRRAGELASDVDGLPVRGEVVGVAGCGTSWLVSQCYAALRERAGHGWTDAFSASEAPATRDYDRLVVITRSGTTTEVLDLLGALRGRTRTVVLCADPRAPAAHLSDDVVALDFADERSVVQTRFATSALALLRSHLGEDARSLAADAEAKLAQPLPSGAVEASQFTFLGGGWTVGLAHEAALKIREASLSWAESYPATEFRHGPISVADQRSVVWFLGEEPRGLAEEAAATGAVVVTAPGDPMAELVRVQRLAVAVAARRGLDPDHPRNLTRSVVLSRPPEG